MPAARESHKAADLRVHVGPAWVSPDPATVVLPAGQRVEAPAQQPAFSVPVTPGLWSGSVRCYHPEMHAAEVTVARELARLAARPPLPIRAKTNPRAKIDAWITKNEKETGKQPSTHTAVSAQHSVHVPQSANCPGTRVCCACSAGMKLSQGQRAAVQAASNSPILVLTGGPGCGKTYTTATIVKLWSAMNKHVKLAAPTGERGPLAISTVCALHQVIVLPKSTSAGSGSVRHSMMAANFLALGCNLYKSHAVLGCYIE